jgi:microcompartment protein CcmL/EutN
VGELVSTHIIPRPDEETELASFTAGELRKLASRTPGFPLSPLQISQATKAALLEGFQAISAPGETSAHAEQTRAPSMPRKSSKKSPRA